MTEGPASLITEATRRGHSRDEIIAELSTGQQESGWRMVWDPTRRWFVSRVQCTCGWQSRTVRGEVDARIQECDRLLEAHRGSDECSGPA